MLHSPERERPEPKLFLKREFFNMAESGEKTLEIRPESGSVVLELSAGQETILSSGDGREIKVKILGIRKYENLETVISSEDLSKVGRGINKDNAQSVWKKLYPSNPQKISVIEFEKI